MRSNAVHKMQHASSPYCMPTFKPLQVEAGHGNQTCLLFEGNEPGHSDFVTYSQVLDEVCRLVGGLHAKARQPKTNACTSC